MPEPKGRKADEESKAEPAITADNATPKAAATADNATPKAAATADTATPKADTATPKADTKAGGSAVVPKKPSDRKRRGQREDAPPKETTKRLNAFGEEEEEEAPQRRITGPGTRRWVAPAFIVVGLLGVVWLVVYYIAGRDVPVMSRLGDWNILIGMGLMAASLGLSMLWK